MKKLICSVCIGGLALAMTALGANKYQGNEESTTAPVHRGSSSAKVTAPAASRHVTSAQPAERSFSGASVRQRTIASSPRVRSNATVRSSARVRSDFANAKVRNNVTVNRERSARVRNDVAVKRERSARVRDNVAVNRERNFARNRNVNVGSNFAVNRNRLATRNAVVTNNWRGERFSGRNYVVFRNYSRQWHNRDWWRHHYNRILFVDGGWWYWNAGYWFPAWGYDSYSYYPYDGPIYGYSGAGPGQVVADVQTQLARDGYYTGPIDGVLGPETRQAIAAFQADNGLIVTSTVDEPTVAALGLA